MISQDTLLVMLECGFLMTAWLAFCPSSNSERIAGRLKRMACGFIAGLQSEV